MSADEANDEASFAALSAHVSAAFSSYDGSHDFAHLERVVASARALSRACGAPAPTAALVLRAALLHDMDDKKYGGDEVAQPRARAAMHACGVPECDVEATCAVIRGVSYTSEVARAADGSAQAAAADARVALATAVVQDADRLDAIGATGIARCFCFGGSRNRPLAESVAHFHEKLLKLKGLMKTEAGRAAAEARHDTMIAFLSALQKEWSGEL
jgi:uncharacterized protein